MTEVSSLATVHDLSRNILNGYLDRLRETDPYPEVEVHGVMLHSIYWLAGHVAWAENRLAMKGVVEQPLDIPWLDKFGFGTTLGSREGLPEFSEVVATMHQVHAETQRALHAMNDAELELPNGLPTAFGDKPKRFVLHHMIRHEPMHAGQLAWLCKIHGIKTF